MEAPQGPDAVQHMVYEDFGASSGSAKSHTSPVIFSYGFKELRLEIWPF